MESRVTPLQSPDLLKTELELTELGLQGQTYALQLPVCPPHDLGFKDNAAQVYRTAEVGRRCLTRLEKLQQELREQEVPGEDESIAYLEARVEALEALKRKKLKEKIKSLEDELAHDT